MQLAALIGETLDEDSQDVWENECVPDDATMAQFTIRWILDFDAVTTVIPGSTTPEHVAENLAAADLPSLSHETHGAVRDVYEAHLYDAVHHRW